MSIIVERTEAPFHFVAKNDTGNEIHMDGSPDIGGVNAGARPMQVLLMSLAGCAGIDVVSILQKQRQEFTAFRMEVDGERREEQQAKPFSAITVHFLFEGSVDPDKAKKAIDLSLEKYCSVAMTINKSATISYRLSVNGTEHVG